jgi:hypothetical protein
MLGPSDSFGVFASLLMARHDRAHHNPNCDHACDNQCTGQVVQRVGLGGLGNHGLQRKVPPRLGTPNPSMSISAAADYHVKLKNALFDSMFPKKLAA